jgi:hypothetical protein
MSSESVRYDWVVVGMVVPLTNNKRCLTPICNVKERDKVLRFPSGNAHVLRCDAYAPSPCPNTRC